MYGFSLSPVCLAPSSIISHKGVHPEILSFFAILPAGLIHGLYNFSVGYGINYGIAVDGIGLILVVYLYKSLEKISPYRKYSAEDSEKAIEEIKISLSFHAKNEFLLRRLALYHFPKGEYGNALEFIDQALVINPKSKLSAIYKAVALFGLGQPEAGESLLSKSQGMINVHHKKIRREISLFVPDLKLKQDILSLIEPSRKNAKRI